MKSERRLSIALFYMSRRMSKSTDSNPLQMLHFVDLTVADG